MKGISEDSLLFGKKGRGRKKESLFEEWLKIWKKQRKYVKIKENGRRKIAFLKEKKRARETG